MENCGRTDAFRWVIVALLFMILFVFQQSYACLPPLFSEIQKDIPMTKAEMGTIFAMVTLAPIFLSLAAGGVSDRFGSRWIVAGALVAAALGAAMRIFAGSVVGLTASTILVGVAMALLSPNMPKVLGAWFPPIEMGKVSGIVFSAAPIGVGVGLATGASILSPAFGGWRGAMAFISGLCLVAAAAWMLLYREPESVAAGGQHNVLANLSRVLKIRDVWLVGLFFGFFSFAIGPVMSLLPIVLEERGIAHSGEFVAIVMWVSVAGTLLAGVASDKMGRRKPFLVTSALLAAICIPGLASLTGIPLVMALVITGLAQGISFPIIMALPVEIKGVGPSLAASAVGLIFMLGNIVGIAGPIVSGKMIDATGSPLTAFLLIGGLLLVSAGVIAFIEETGKGRAPAAVPFAAGGGRSGTDLESIGRGDRI